MLDGHAEIDLVGGRGEELPYGRWVEEKDQVRWECADLERVALHLSLFLQKRRAADAELQHLEDHSSEQHEKRQDRNCYQRRDPGELHCCEPKW